MDTLFLKLHLDKITISAVRDGFSFLGAYLKPHRTYIGNRTKGNFFGALEKWNEKIRQNGGILISDERDTFLSSINSYLGIMKQFSTYRLRKKILRENMNASFWNEFFISGGYGKITRRKKIEN